ncbi:hypothetical protein QTP70_013070 [Hemibagrus guttatus]|uniref:Long-chain specific acyl-CoA dehydrogenase, mitochondrial n=1 Tax=Hemibagrus guttatus TaxID=175788 RepID=A0AAE0RB07_9TELE|nr:hypothetical protein QTP70_013070 [Hemibagrus guttatus]
MMLSRCVSSFRCRIKSAPVLLCCRMEHSQQDRPAPFRPETSMAKTMMDIGSRRIFSEEHDLFRQNVRRFFKEEVVPYHRESVILLLCLCISRNSVSAVTVYQRKSRNSVSAWEKAGEVSREVWEKAGLQGLLGIYTPVEHGGVGGDLLSAAIMWEEQMYSNCSGPGFSLHSEIVMPYISHYGSQAQIERYLSPMAAGKCIGAIAMSEPGAGSDIQGVKTYARRDGTDWILNGNKVFITNGWMSDLVIVVAVTNREVKSAAHGLSLFLVESGTKGFTKGRKLEKIGLKAQDTAELFFEDVRLPADSVLGELNKGFYYLMNELPQERLIIAVMALASCEFMFEETRNYVTQRKAFGRTIADLQGIQAIINYKTTQSACDSDASLPDALNDFYARFEAQNNVAARKPIPPPNNQVLCLSMADVRRALCRVNPQKSAGPDNFPGRVLRECAEQTVQHRLAELKTEICVSRAFIDNCIHLHSEKKLDSSTASMAKYWASELQNKVATQCLQLHDSVLLCWFLTYFPHILVLRAFVDARVQPIYGGTNEIMKELIARTIVGHR